MSQFSVVIPTYQRPDDLARCLEQLKPGAQTLASEHYEVIVSDDQGKGSKTQVLVREQYPWVTWVTGPGRGPAANRNNGALEAQGKWLVFTDDDCIPNPEWLKAYREASRSHRNESSICVLEGATVPEGPRPRMDVVAPINEDGGNLWSCNFAIEAKAFRDLGGFDEDYTFALEDMDFAARIRKSPFESIFVRDAEVVHPWRRVDSPFLDFRRRLKGWLRFARKHPDIVSGYNVGWVAGPAKKVLSLSSLKKEGVYVMYLISTLETVIRISAVSISKLVFKNSS